MNKLNQESSGDTVIIDVREKDEFESEHIERSIHLPLSQFSLTGPGVLNQVKNKNIQLLCRSGNRAKLAQAQIVQLGFGELKTKVIEGGIIKWMEQGKPVVRHKTGHLPLMRQVQLVAGLLVLLGIIGAEWIDPRMRFLSAFVGAGLAFAGATGFCGMANILAMLPYNKGTVKRDIHCGQK